MNQNKLKSYFGFAIKSGNVIFGYDNLFKSKKAPLLVVISPDLAEKMANKVKIFCDEHKINLLTLENLNLSDIINRDNCKVLGILDLELSKVIAKEIMQQKNIGEN